MALIGQPVVTRFTEREEGWKFTVSGGQLTGVVAAHLDRETLVLTQQATGTSATTVITSASVPAGYGGYKLKSRKNVTSSKRQFRDIEETWYYTNGVWATSP